MNIKDFNEHVDAVVAASADLLKRKGEEYSSDVDRLSNFKRNAEKQRQTVLNVWKTYYGKHADSLDSYFARVQQVAERKAMRHIAGNAAEIALMVQRSDAGRADVVFEAMDSAVKDVDWVKLVTTYLPAALEEVNDSLSEPIEGRFHDIINYCILGLAILKELENNNGN